MPHKEKKDAITPANCPLHVDVVEHMQSPIAFYHMYTQRKRIDKCHYLHLSIKKTIFLQLRE